MRITGRLAMGCCRLFRITRNTWERRATEKPPTGAMSPMMALMFTGPGESFVRIFRPVSSPEHHTSALPPLLQSRMQRQKLPGAGWWLRSPRLSIRWLRRRESTAQHSRSLAQRFLENTRNLERGGEVAHADVIKAQVQLDQQQVAFEEAELAMTNAHLALAALISPNLDQNFTAVDDMDHTPVLPPLEEVKRLAARNNQDVRAALETLEMAKQDVTIARAGFFPTLSFTGNYGIEANAFALHSRAAAFPELGPLPNLGYFITGTLDIPIWNWGTTRSKLHQAEY